MRFRFWILLLPMLAHAADDKVTRGAAIYRTSCAVTYCHGADGKAGRAPALGGRTFDAVTVLTTLYRGVPNTSMPSFAAQLKPDEIEAVAAYVVSLNASTPVSPAAAKPAAAAAMPADVAKGRLLFSDAARTGACSSCHEAGGRGIPVSLALQDLKTARLGDLRTLATPNVMTARPAGEDAFPAEVVEKTASRIRVYDLSSRLPVLRAFKPSGVELTAGSSWRHSTAASLYDDAELESILAYLRWLAAQ